MSAMVDLIDGEYVERPRRLPSGGDQLDIFTAAHHDDRLCNYGEVGTCIEPATHAVVGTTESGPHAGLVARLECCLAHANYYARGWLGPHLLYPGVRGAVWIEPLVPVTA